MPSTFHLERAIAAWRRPLEHHAHVSPDDLEELEGTLRDRIDTYVAAGATPEDAFHQAVDRSGSFGNVDVEYRKVFWGKAKREHRLVREMQGRLSLVASYVVLALRTIRKHWGFTAINLVGLALGLACVMLIGLYVRYEWSYDTFHAQADRIYRIAREDPGSTFMGTNQYAVTPAPLEQALKETFPEVEHVVQLEPVEVLLGTDTQGFFENGLFATSGLFEVFSFPLLEGDAQTALTDPLSIVLTERLAEKYFDDTSAVGQALPFKFGNAEGELRVTGVVADPPANSHIQFDFLVSITTSSTYRFLMRRNDWDSNNYRTYVSLQPTYDLASFSEKLSGLAEQHLRELPFYQENPERVSMYFPQALTDIHLHSRMNFELGPNGNITYVYLLVALGLLVLVLACVNYINLATARSAGRAHEVGVRKVVGAHQGQLIGQFMGESVLVTLLALGVAVVLAQAVLPAFSALTARPLVLVWYGYEGFWLFILALGTLVGLLTGAYPALVLASYKPVVVMQGVRTNRRSGLTLRNGLVVAQFAATAALLVGTVVIYQQLNFVRTADTGMNREAIVSVAMKDPAARKQFDTVKQSMLAHAGVVSVAATRFGPTNMMGQTRTNVWEGSDGEQQLSLYQNPVMPGFEDVLGLELVAGRGFSETPRTQGREEILINEALVQQLGWDDPLGKWLGFQGREGEVVGVVKDFHFQSFQQTIAPLVLYIDTFWFSSALVKVQPEQVPEVLNHLERVMATFAPAYPFEYEFLDDAYQRTYRTEQQLGQVFSYITGLAICIACLGLLGLAVFFATQRTREVGIRKVFGATEADILVLLSKDFMRLVGLALVIGLPIAYFAMSQWLEGFAYRVFLGWETFALVGVGILGLAILTVGYQALRAARHRPADALRHP